ncbi:DUF1613-domain-containing protein [Polychaeton citri CBS 116435]|uniref:tRNA (uracil-O(2)-)-methyltransferase n=1 Tax=Polychaeton citri CBS 116435 TaxID=1314669 RepID=A0A9P4UR55_9PEZI|nr:DUF1613-domain-containing protein [Polychaeton citri CBS 116435]
MIQSPCTFPPSIFKRIMLNLIKNPNITSSHLFRADILFDDHGDEDKDSRGILKEALRDDVTPRKFPAVEGLEIVRTTVRVLIPRNQSLDRELVQTCLILEGKKGQVQKTVVVYLPHVGKEEDVPFYHPAVASLAFVHQWQPLITAKKDDHNAESGHGSLCVHFKLFPVTTHIPSEKLNRTALRLVQTLHKHGQGQLAGYSKRVHLDRVIPQKQYQDTYACLKGKYGAKLAQSWVEVTDPSKHVFEDLAIAAWLIEVWRDLYSTPSDERINGDKNKMAFPGFVDIGCGNGVLVSILVEEGYEGWGFDARERKTWGIFSPEVQKRLERRVLVPKVFKGAIGVSKEYQPSSQEEHVWHDGTFEGAPFIISNHADELTAWTPLLAYLNNSAFVAIPCCSYDLSGARFRAPLTLKSKKDRAEQQEEKSSGDKHSHVDLQKKQAAETGSLAKTPAQKKMPSAYSSLCSYVSALTEEVDIVPESDVLRIPSTRNSCILGRKGGSDNEYSSDAKIKKVKAIIEQESGRTLTSVAEDWIGRVQKLMLKPGSGH